MSYDKNTWKDNDYITTNDMNRIEKGLEYVANKASSSYVKTIWKNGDIVTANKLNNIENGIEKITKLVDSDFNLQTKTITYTPTENQITDIITKDIDYDFLDEVNVNVNAIPNNYVGSSIPRRNSNNITVIQNPLSVSVPKGYYESSISKELDLEPSLVRFIDYDGTILHEYSKDEFLALSSMPSNPTHSGLVSQGWNWSLSDAKIYVEQWGYLDIGQMYITQSGDTEIDVEFPEDSLRLSPYLSLAINGTVEIDWGDNSTITNKTGTSLTSRITDINHTYSQPGNYTIKIHAVSGEFSLYCSNNYTLLHNNSGSINRNYIYSTKIKSARIGENCSIYSYAFSNCYSLKSVTIPSGVTTIGSQAFYDCYSLNSVTIPSTVTTIGYQAFFNCSSLNSVTIPNTVTTIGDSAFCNCYSLQSITIPNTVTSIGSQALYNCYSLNIRVLGSFNIKRVIPNEDIIIYPNSDISNCIFSNNYFIKNIVIQPNRDKIGSYAFYNCYSLNSITIPDSITTIGGSVFYNCYSLKSVTIPSGVTSMSGSVFYNCYSLNSITIPSGVTSINSNVFQYCYSLKSVTIPSGVTSMGGSVFRDCQSLQSITLPNTITSIGSYAFYNCYSLNSITIPEGVTSIGNYIFEYCHSLNSVTIPSGVTSIGTSAFYNCYSLKEVHLKPTTPPTLGTSTFSSVPSDCIFYVPQGTLSVYQSATGWSDYASQMQEESN